MEPKRRPSRFTPMKLGPRAQAAFEAPLSVVVGVVLGIVVDRWLGTSPIFTFIFLVLGLVSGLMRLIALGKVNGPPP